MRGVVLDERRQPVPYASVELVGQGRGTVADAQGRFALALPGPTPAGAQPGLRAGHGAVAARQGGADRAAATRQLYPG
ncbi:MAG: hypothetical protein WKG07_45480 [Hymenobacter sp.]